MLKFKLLEVDSTVFDLYDNRVLFEKEVDRNILTEDKAEDLIAFVDSLESELVGNIDVPSIFAFFNDDEIIYRGCFDYPANGFKDVASLRDTILMDLFGVVYLEDKSLLEDKTGKVIYTTYVEDKKEALDGYTFVSKDATTGKIYALTAENKLIVLDENYKDSGTFSVNISNINPSSLFVDGEFAYISSYDINSNNKNKVVVVRLADKAVSQIGNGWGFNKVMGEDAIWHPTAVTSDDTHVYINCCKNVLIRVYDKETIRNSWSSLAGNGSLVSKYIRLAGKAPHGTDSRCALAVVENTLYVSYTGDAKVYGYTLYDLDVNAEYVIPTTALTSAFSFTLPVSGNVERIVVDDEVVSVKVGASVYVFSKENFADYANLNYLTGTSVDSNTLSIINSAVEEEGVTIVTGVRNGEIVKTFLKAEHITSANSSAELTDIKASNLLVKADEIFKDEDDDASRNSVKFKLRFPISGKIENDNLVITSMYMKELRGSKIAANIKGVEDPVIVLDLTDEVVQPFMKNTYKTGLTTTGGTYVTTYGEKINISKLNVLDIIDFVVLHNDKSLSIINDLKTDWTLGYSGTDGQRYIRITRDHARDYAQIFTNMSFAFGSKLLSDSLDHFTYLTRAIFISDVQNMSNSTPVAWYHLDVDDPNYNPQDKFTFLSRVGINRLPGVTKGYGYHWTVSVDTRQSGVASAGAAGGWLAMSNGFTKQGTDSVTNYALVHEFGHSRNWQHGSSFAYGVFSDGQAHTDGTRDLFVQLCKTLLRMGVLPYQDQFDPEKYDTLALNQIESKVYLSGKGSEWWNEDILNHVNKKVAAINAFADEYDANLENLRAEYTEKMDALQAHLDNYIKVNSKPAVSNHNATYAPWRSIVEKLDEFQWVKEKMPGSNLTFWDRMNQTYSQGRPVQVIKEYALSRVANPYNRNSLLNPNNYSSTTTFLNLGPECKHDHEEA